MNIRFVYLQELEEAEFIPMPDTPSSASMDVPQDISASLPQHTEASPPATSQITEGVLQVRRRPCEGWMGKYKVGSRGESEAMWRMNKGAVERRLCR